jgi:putative transcriptional regulator
MTRKYKSAAFAAIHETMEALHEIGAVDKQTMRNFDAACLTPIQQFTPEQIREIRQRENISQPVLARYLNVSKNLISDWERGIKKPGGPALRLLGMIEKNGLAAVF